MRPFNNRSKKFQNTNLAVILLIGFLVARAGTCFGAEADTEIKVKWFGPEGGDIRALAMDSVNPNVLYAGSDEGAIYQSQNGGKSWNRLNAPMEGKDLVIQRIVTDPRFPRTLWVAAWRLHSSGGSLWRSRDEGATWEEIFSKAEEASVRDFVIPAVFTDRFFLITLQGIFRSSDLGSHWELLPGTSRLSYGIKTLWVSPWAPDQLLAGTRRLIYQSLDGGKTWGLSSEGIPTDSDIFRILPLDVTGKQLLAAACSGIYRTVDGGQTWKKTILTHDGKQMEKRVLCLATNKDALTIYAGTSTGLYKSVDGGRSWTFRFGEKWIIHDIVVDPANREVLSMAAEDEGIQRSTDGGFSFLPRNHGILHRGVSAILGDRPSGKEILIGVSKDYLEGGIYRSADGGNTWLKELMENGNQSVEIYSLLKLSVPLPMVLAGTADGLFIKQATKGYWKRLPTTQVSGRIQSLAYASNLEFQRILAAGGEGIFLSEDGFSWEKPTLPFQEGVEKTIFSLAVSKRGSPKILAGGIGRIWISEDLGHSWRMIKRGLPNVPVQAMLCPNDLGTAWYVGTRSGIFRSTDQGNKWSKVGDSLGAIDVTSLVSLTLPKSPGTNPRESRNDCLFAVDGYTGGLLYSCEGNDEWQRFSAWKSRLWTLWANSIPDRFLYGGTSGEGYFTLDAFQLFGVKAKPGGD